MQAQKITKIDARLATASTLNMAFFDTRSCNEFYLPKINSNIDVNGAFNNQSSLESLNSDCIAMSISFGASPKLTEQSVLNLINAAAANVTYTLHSTVYNKCASGGEWYTDVQAAIDAKAQQGYTVTLISA